MIPLLINDLAELDEPLVIVLDDYHVIDNRHVHGPIEGLIERLPATAQLVIATRSDPPLALSRLRAGGHLIEIRGDDLRFTTDEARMFLNHVLELDLDDDEVARLHGRTEGWAAGLSSRVCRSGAARIRASSSRRLPAMTSRSWTTWPPRSSTVNRAEVRQFLLRSSILDRLAGPLCQR